MPNAFVQLTPDLERACREALVLTTTERLRRNLVLAYNQARQQAGDAAWSTPRVQTLESHIASTYGERCWTDLDLPVLLSAEAEFLLFRGTAPPGGAALVRLAQQAWTLCHQWSIPLTPSALARTENGRVFLDWTERVRRRLASEGAITRAELAQRSDLISTEPELVCLAFEHVPRALSAWLDQQSSAGRRVSFVQADPHPVAEMAHTAFDTRAEELSAAAQWAHQLLVSRGDDVRIGIVVPDLGQHHHAVLRQFTAEFDPLLDKGTEGLLDIAGGTPLGDQPVWQGARNWLQLCFDSLPAATARACLNDPYLDLPRLPGLPALLPPELNLRILDRLLELPALREQLAALPAPQDRPVGDWLEIFMRTLDRAGWTGRGTGSVQYQAWLEIRRRVEALRLTGDRRPVTGAEALAGLEQLLDDVTFAPERPPAPVQVMGYLETTGLQFTHLWITGLDDQTWPQLPNPNPFVPAELRRRHGVARSTPSEEADFAAERLRHWRHSAQQLIVSHARQSAGSELRPSPLIRDYPEVRLADLHPQRAHPGFAHGDGRIEWIQDTSGAPLPGGRHRGGTGRFRDQALCPMRGYAIHRLRLDETRTPHGLPDALDRGTLVHEALHRLYEICREGIRNPSELTREDLEHAADRALARHYARFPVPFKTRERQRLVALLAAWNALECERDGVVIEALELDTHAEFDQIGLRLRIDRMDRIQGDLVVIDYKTGQVGNRLNQDRLIDPQLPLYALSNPDIRGVLYAQVDEQQPRLKGIAAMNLDQRGIEPPMGDSWETQLDRWRGQIDTLTREVREGVASVTPYSKEVCRNCHLQSFCRISLEADAEDER